MSKARWQRREYEKAAMVAARRTRVLYLFWTRRGRKSTTLGAMAFDAMSASPGQSVIAASASLLVGSELVSMTLSATEHAIKVQQEAEALRQSLSNSCAGAGGEVQLVAAASDTGKVYKTISDEDYADLYRSKRLEFRLYFDRTRYSRLLVIAPNPATARGWGGWVFRDEQMFVHPALERDLQTATDPIIDTDPTFRLVYASNLCGDDRHPGYEMTMPRDNQVFTPNPQGHFYISQTGILVHRVDLADAYAAGHTLFDKKSGKPMPLEQALSGMSIAARKNNYMLVHEASGTAAVDALALHSAQQRGIGRCACIYVDSDLDFQKALSWLAAHLAPGVPTSIGFDVATTNSGQSNPSSCTITQQHGIELVSPLDVLWKTRDARLAKERIRSIVDVCLGRGAKPRRFVIDASSERYFADEVRQDLSALVPVELVLNGATVDPRPVGYDAPINYKTYLGDLYCSQLNDNRYVLPPETYLKKDHRQVIKERGVFSCEVDSTDGGHGDTFDSGKLALYGLLCASGPTEAFAVARGSFGLDEPEPSTRLRPDHRGDDGPAATAQYL
jgi:hypothetical protein